MKNKFIIILLIFILSACSSKKPFNININSLELEVGDSTLLPIKLNNITLEDLSFTLRDQGIIEIADLNIEARQIGSTELTIAANGYEVTIAINVSQVSVHLNVSSPYLEVGKSMIVFMSNFANFEDFIWTNSNPLVGSFNEFNVFSALSPGKSTITATKKDDSSIKGTLEIEVIAIKPLIYVASSLLEVGDKVQLLIADVYNLPLSAYNIIISEPKVLALDKNYQLTALKEGSSEIKIVAKDNPLVYNTMEITVAKRTLFTLEPTSGPLFIKATNKTGIVNAGETLDYTVAGLNNPLNYRFHSLDATIVGITDMGVIWGIKEGMAKINVIAKSDASIRGTITVTVKGSSNVDYITRLINAGIGEEGYKAGPNNNNKYGEWFEYPNEAWCAMFVSWCANQAGIGIDVIPKYSSVAGGMEWFRIRDQLKYKESYTPKPGDIIFFASQGASHTGIVVRCDGERVYTIEGNTSSSVRQRNYLLTYGQITAYGTPAYPPFS